MIYLYVFINDWTASNITLSAIAMKIIMVVSL